MCCSQIFQGALDDFAASGKAFTCGVCLHACGPLTDAALRLCLAHGAAYVLCPCCYGQLPAAGGQPRSAHFGGGGFGEEQFALLGAGAEFSVVKDSDWGFAATPAFALAKRCMLAIDADRSWWAQETAGYRYERLWAMRRGQPPGRAPVSSSTGGGGANYWAPLTRKRHTMPHSAQSQHANHWAPRMRKRHQQEHWPQRPTESSDPTQHAKGRTGDRPGPRKGATTRRNVTQGGGGGLFYLRFANSRTVATVSVHCNWRKNVLHLFRCCAFLGQVTVPFHPMPSGGGGMGGAIERGMKQEMLSYRMTPCHRHVVSALNQF